MDLSKMYTNIFKFLLFMNNPGNENKIRPLIQSSNVNSVDENGSSALLLAAEKGYNQCVFKCEIFVVRNHLV